MIIKRWFGEDRITPAGAGKTRRTGFRHEYTADHPRRCGENCMTLNPQTMTKGSPPQVRGKPFPADGSSTVRRITPAGAGKTFLSHLFCWLCQGSPPQVRGKRSIGQLLFLPEGITPAGAGKTIVPVLFLCLPADHPRRCGENRVNLLCYALLDGSPPQVRGKPRERVKVQRVNGITPAGAGKTYTIAISTPVLRDHPRRCGENVSPLPNLSPL